MFSRMLSSTCIRRGRAGAALVVTAMGLASLLPVSATLAQTTGDMYLTSDTTLEDDHVGRIIIAADNIYLDCGGHSIIDPGGGPVPGVAIDGRSGVTVTNCHVRGFFRGFFVIGSSHVTLTDNTAFDNDEFGFVFPNSAWVTLINNHAKGNSKGFSLGTTSNFRIQGNLSESNEDFGLQISGGNRHQVHNNVFTGNTIGINIVNSSGINFTRNVSCSNVSSDLNFVSGEKIVLNNNEFCSVTGL